MINAKEIRKNTFYLTFKKGVKAWFLLVCVCFLFAFIGSSNSDSSAFVSTADSVIGLNNQVSPDNVSLLTQYVLSESFVNRFPFLNSEILVSLINSASKANTWIINLLAANFAYFKRNQGEVIVALLLTALISFCIKFFVQSSFDLGRYRYQLENSCQKEVKFSRIFAPFHKKDLLNIIITMFKYKFLLLLWLFTIVGFFIKYFEYFMIPFILAENPSIKFKEAKKLSKELTMGHKKEMFLTHLSLWYMWILRFIPLLNITIAIPYLNMLDTQIYLKLRDKKNKDIFIERGFDSIYEEGKKNPEYLMDDVIKSVKELRKDIKSDIVRLRGDYNIYDYIFFFFSFCFVGWVWEVLLHLVQEHEIVNRGTMYGPWLPIYGCGGVLIIFFLNRFKDNKWKVLFLTMLLCGVLEYASSWILDYIFNSTYWDYKNMLVNINGRICLAGLLAFGFGGLFGIYVAAPRLSLLLDKLGSKKTKLLCYILVSLFGLDLLACYLYGFNTGSGVGGEFED